MMTATITTLPTSDAPKRKRVDPGADYEGQALMIVNRCVLLRKRPKIWTLVKAIERELKRAHARGLKEGREMGSATVIRVARKEPT